ncbi:hypothetical protein AVEN_12969-1 [Araneus ventricosus]|uniref:Uncharacterized protein n=1 Tax=Araneus ventricosus TaxID=182803 RepID=A0A4Y2L7G3_ARAVE|nr:hypothetical protein AVEN_12969-1 [Araneus ventricosus]
MRVCLVSTKQSSICILSREQTSFRGIPTTEFKSSTRDLRRLWLARISPFPLLCVSAIQIIDEISGNTALQSTLFPKSSQTKEVLRKLSCAQEIRVCLVSTKQSSN